MCNFMKLFEKLQNQYSVAISRKSQIRYIRERAPTSLLCDWGSRALTCDHRFFSISIDLRTLALPQTQPASEPRHLHR